MATVMRAEVTTQAIAEEMTGVVGRVGHQVDLVGQEVATDRVAVVGQEAHLDLTCCLGRPQAMTHKRSCCGRWPCWPNHRPRLTRQL